MKWLVASAALAAATVSAPASAATLVINVAGILSFDELGSTANETLTYDLAGAHITGIGWDVDLFAISPSWLSEMRIYFGGSDYSGGLFLTPGIGSTVSGFGSFASGGVVDLVGIGFDFTVAASGLYVEFFEGFDDYPDGGLDGVYRSGTLTVEYTPAIVPGIPEPTIWVTMIAGFGLVGAGLRRREIPVVTA